MIYEDKVEITKILREFHVESRRRVQTGKGKILSRDAFDLLDSARFPIPPHPGYRSVEDVS